MEQNIYKNILVIIVGLLILNLWIENDYLGFTIIGFGVLTIFIEKSAIGLNWLWMKLAFVLGWINSRILLTILYYVFLVPIAFMAKLFKGTSIDLNKNSKSMYELRNHTFTKKDLENMW